MANNKVAIVITCYNYGAYLAEAIESALAQTHPCDVIVVNDGSTDNTSEIMKRYPIIAVEQTNKGAPAAMNAGIEAADTEWILPLAADDTIEPEMVEKCLSVNADIIGVGTRYFGDSNGTFSFMPQPTYSDFRVQNRLVGTSLFRKIIWEDIGRFDETLTRGYEDWDFWLRATKKGYVVVSIPDVLFNYRKHGISLTSTAIENHNELLSYILGKN